MIHQYRYDLSFSEQMQSADIHNISNGFQGTYIYTYMYNYINVNILHLISKSFSVENNSVATVIKGV